MNFLQQLSSFVRDLISNIPTRRCGLCEKWFPEKDITYERSNLGFSVGLCPACHKSIFKPFSK